jgi:hypothetical protein
LQTILPEKGFKKCLPAAPFSPQRDGANVHGPVTIGVARRSRKKSK